jgi:hypothetical protein
MENYAKIKCIKCGEDKFVGEDGPALSIGKLRASYVCEKCKSNIKEQTGAGAGATTTATFQPAVGPEGSASKSGSFPGGNLEKKKRRRKTEQIRRDPPAIKEAIKFSDRLKRSSLKSN